MEGLLGDVIAGKTAGWPFRPDGPEATAFLAAAAAHGVDALIGWNARLDRWPGAIRAGLTRALQEQRLLEALRRPELDRVLDALNRAGLRPLLFKGAALAYTAYPDPALRPRDDADLLIRKADLPVACAALESLGYRRRLHTIGALVTHQAPYVRIDRGGYHHVVDLHWKVANPHVFAEAVAHDDLVKAARPAPALPADAAAPCATHALLIACMHRVAHHNDSHKLIWLYDIHLLASQMCAVELDSFARLAVAGGMSTICRKGLVLAAERFGTALPPAILACLAPQPDRPEPAAAYLGGRLRKVDVLASDLGALSGWRARVALLKEHLFPPASYMLASYGPSGRARLAFWYARRIVAGAPRWFRRMK